MSLLNPDEMDALMSAMKDGSVPHGRDRRPPVEAKPYPLAEANRDFSRISAQLEGQLFEAARVFGASFAARTRIAVTCEATVPNTMTLGTLLMAHVNSVVGVFTTAADERVGLVLVPANVARTLLLAALGQANPGAEADSAVTSDGRPSFTAVERQVLAKVLQILENAVGDAVADQLVERPRLSRIELDARLVAQRPTESVVTTAFSMSGALDARFELSFPMSWLKSRARSAPGPVVVENAASRSFTTRLRAEIDQVDLELHIMLGSTRMSLDQLLAMKTGDLITLNTSEASLLPVVVGGRAKWMGRPQLNNGTVSVVLEEEDELPTRAPAERSSPVVARAPSLPSNASPAPPAPGASGLVTNRPAARPAPAAAAAAPAAPAKGAAPATPEKRQ